MTEPALMRPPRVTTACLFVGLSCAMLLYYAASTLSNWGSIEVQEQVRKALADERFNAAGLEVTDVMGWLRGALMGAVAVSVAGTIFAIYTALGHQASRVILTIICGLLGLTFLLSFPFGVLPAVFSIVCAVHLWRADARLWFAVKNGAALPPEAEGKPRPDPFATPVMPAGVEAPAPTAGTPVAQLPAVTTTRAPQPKAVLAAGLVALIMSAMVAVVCSVNALFYAVAKSEYVRMISEYPLMRDALRQLETSPAELARNVFIGCTIAAIVALVAVAAAGATLAGKRMGRSLLVILAILTLPISIATFPVGLMWTAGAVVTLVLLKRPDSRSWFDKS